MNAFNNPQDKIDFLKRYKLMSKDASDLPNFYYFKSTNDTPVACEVIGYDQTFDNWAVITIKASDEIINIHSSYLLEMKRKGAAFYKSNPSTPDNKDSVNGYVVLDIETTGTNHKKDGIIEISAIKCIENDIYEFSELINISSIIPINITLLTGITNEMSSDAKPIDDVLPRFLDFIGNFPLIGHNIKAFDIYFINDACNDLNLPEIKNELIDTLQLARMYLPNLDKHSLSNICDFYGIDTSGAHRALTDCYMCNECYQRFLKITNINFEENLQALLENTIKELELPDNGLIIQANGGKKKKTASIYINEPPFPATKEESKKIYTTQSILNFEEDNNFIILLVSQSAFDYVQLPEHIRYEEKKQAKSTFIKVYFPKYHSGLYTYIKQIICYRIKNYTSSAALFGCCDRFRLCSDAKKCVHENKLYSTACMYRMNLDSGHIFYGKNRNVD